MHIPSFRLFDRIRTKTVIAGIKYFGIIGLRIVMMKFFGNKNNQCDLSDSDTKQTIINKFHLLYVENNKQTFDNTYWLGNHAVKCPLDLWIYQELIYKTKPDFIIETGTNEGGSALFLANVCDILNHGEIITVDIASVKNKPIHPRIHYLQGNSTSSDTIDQIKNILNKKADKKVMVILDDDHSEKHVLNEIELYGKLVTIGNYLIVEDTAMAGHPSYPELPSGPMESVQKYLQLHKDFEIDLCCDKFFMTFNPNGFLRKIL